MHMQKKGALLETAEEANMLYLLAKYFIFSVIIIFPKNSRKPCIYNSRKV